MIYGFLLTLHLLICVTLILVVLLQSGKGGGLAGAFGGMGGAGQSLFGGRGAATFLSKATTVLGIAFMTTSLVLALMAGGRTSGPRSVIRESQSNSGTQPPPATSAPIEIPGDQGLPPVGGSDLEQGKAPAGQEQQGQPAPGNQAAPSQNPSPDGGSSNETGTPGTSGN